MKLRTVLATSLAIAGAFLMAPAAMASTASCTTLASCQAAGTPPQGTVNFTIIVPQVMRFTLGANTATSPSLTYNIPAASLGNGAFAPTTTSNAGTTGGAGVVDVQVISNIGGVFNGVQISVDTSAVDDFFDTVAAAGVNGPSWEDITVTSAGGITHPPFGGAPTQWAGTGAVTATGTWTYTYNNDRVINSNPVGYTGSVTYTAAIY